MIVAGCDIGSLTAKAVLLESNNIIAEKIIRVKRTAIESAKVVMDDVLKIADMKIEDISYCCSTGYGRFEIPFATMNMTEISCHGLGAFWTDHSIRGVIDIGGQDCKVIAIDNQGLVSNFVMNEKCAAGTGRNLELLARSINVELEELGPLALQAKKQIEITNKCSIFMELEVLQLLYQGNKLRDIANAIDKAIARRVAQLAQTVKLEREVCITGGVSKNIGVVNHLENFLKVKFKKLDKDPQLMGAIGAAVFAQSKQQEKS